jgi:TIR domain
MKGGSGQHAACDLRSWLCAPIHHGLSKDRHGSGISVTPLIGSLCGLAAGGAGIGIISAARVSATRFPWEIRGRSTAAGVCMYAVEVLLYLALGGFTGWMTVNINATVTVIFAGIAGPPAQMRYASAVREGKGDDGGWREPMPQVGKHLPHRHRVIVCYSHANTAWLERLVVHLGPLHKDGLVDIWSDKQIRPGDHWRAEIDAALGAARFAVLLVSSDFYNSAFIRDVELPNLLAAADTGGCKVTPLLISASRFLSDPVLSQFQTANPDGRTLAAMNAEAAEQVLADLAATIEEEIRRLN